MKALGQAILLNAKRGHFEAIFEALEAKMEVIFTTSLMGIIETLMIRQ